MAKSILGPKPGEPAFGDLNEKTGAAALKEWAISYYEANDITCPGSLNTLCNRLSAGGGYRSNTCGTTCRAVMKYPSKWSVTASSWGKGIPCRRSSAGAEAGICLRATIG
jgi:hypothetical protein